MKHAEQRPYSDWVQCASAVLHIPLLLRHVSSAADFGCNCGPWLRALMDLGIMDVTGVDLGAPGGDLLFPSANYLQHDLSKPLNLGRIFDLVIGLECAEHLNGGELGAENYVNTLTKHGSYILFSAATPGQGGNGHVNEQPHEYWHQKFFARGYAKLDIIRPAIQNDSRVLWWYKQNCFLYVTPPSYQKTLAAYD
jgi:hypothetical protein